ncbi:hypothetical protein T4B_14667 [Trichinella pseudospiralis]|uniref:Uncharacterized protein n=1 Tax=Trichinella pseudospiralis TaxID=6337 RepID=A0A0V1IAA5_TRIPS|nr:hypothetical protein T4A_4071 [Trichinella pseudospiralis]KRZ19771.1 hypothetical protein T4B_14667 [Trichinella pseudospiralis]
MESQQKCFVLCWLRRRGKSVGVRTRSVCVNITFRFDAALEAIATVLHQCQGDLPPALGCGLRQPDSTKRRGTMHNRLFIMGPNLPPALKRKSREPTN